MTAIAVIAVLFIIVLILIIRLQKSKFRATSPLEALKNAPKLKYIAVMPDGKGGYITQAADTREELRRLRPIGRSFIYYNGPYYMPDMSDARLIGNDSTLKQIHYDKFNRSELGKKYGGYVYDAETKSDKLYELIKETKPKAGEWSIFMYIPIIKLDPKKCSSTYACAIDVWSRHNVMRGGWQQVRHTRLID